MFRVSMGLLVVGDVQGFHGYVQGFPCRGLMPCGTPTAVPVRESQR